MTIPVKWWECHHCNGVGCEVCENEGGWFETPAEQEARERMWAEDSHSCSEGQRDA